MAMIEGCDELNRFGQQHAIAKDITRHIAATDHLDRVFLHIDAHFKEVPLNRNPGPACSDTHGLVVIAIGAAAGESIIEPEVLLFGNAIGDIGKARCAFVSRNHKIGVFSIKDLHPLWVDHIAIDNVVSDRQ